MAELFYLSPTAFRFQQGALTNEQSHLRLGAGETPMLLMFGVTIERHPNDGSFSFEDRWSLYASYGVEGLGWSRRTIADVDREALDAGA